MSEDTTRTVSVHLTRDDALYIIMALDAFQSSNQNSGLKVNVENSVHVRKISINILESLPKE